MKGRGDNKGRHAKCDGASYMCTVVFDMAADTQQILSQHIEVFQDLETVDTLWLME